MRTVLRSPFVAALIGGAVVAVALLVLDVGGGGTTTTLVQQSPVASPSGTRTAAAAIYVGGQAESLEGGARAAEEAIDSGAALGVLERFVERTRELAPS